MTEGRFAELIALIAHDLRSPLTSVKGFSTTLIKRWDRFTDEQRLELIRTISIDAERMSRIVTEVVDLARLEAGRLELRRSEVEISEVVGRALEQLAHMNGANRLVDDVDEPLKAWADPERLTHILFNLIENAMKYSEQGPVRVSAHRDGDTVTIAISDEGAGIGPDRIAGVFEGPWGPSSSSSGTGLGLYLTKQLVDAHGGSITVDSKEGHGSTFTVVLPARGPA